MTYSTLQARVKYGYVGPSQSKWFYEVQGHFMLMYALKNLPLNDSCLRMLTF